MGAQIKHEPVTECVRSPGSVHRVAGSDGKCSQVSGSPALLCSHFSRPCWISNMAFSLFLFCSFSGELGV